MEKPKNYQPNSLLDYLERHELEESFESRKAWEKEVWGNIQRLGRIAAQESQNEQNSDI